MKIFQFKTQSTAEWLIYHKFVEKYNKNVTLWADGTIHTKRREFIHSVYRPSIINSNIHYFHSVYRPSIINSNIHYWSVKGFKIVQANNCDYLK